MDIRSIIDPEPSISTPKRPAFAPKPEMRGSYQPPALQSHYSAPPPPSHPARDNRPPQPPPLQAPAHNDFRSPSTSSYQSAPSPYHATPSSAYPGSQHPFLQNASQSPTQGSPAFQYTQRDGHSAPISAGYPPYRQSTPLSQTPTATTPSSAQTYFNPRPQSSQSTSTPTSTQPNAANFPRQSPLISQLQTRVPSQTFAPQQYLSQPSTPLGPPPSLGRNNAGIRRDSPGSFGHSRNHSGGSYGQPPLSAPSPTSEHPGSFHASPSTLGAGQSHSSYRDHSMSVERERERSLSVSPKTRLPSQPRVDVSRVTEHISSLHQTSSQFNAPTPPHDRPGAQLERDSLSSQGPSRSFSLGVNGILNAPTVNESHRPTKESPQQPHKTAGPNGTLKSEPYPSGNSVSIGSYDSPSSTALSKGPSIGELSKPVDPPSQQTYQVDAGRRPFAAHQHQFPSELSDPSVETPTQPPQMPATSILADSTTVPPKHIKMERAKPPLDSVDLSDPPKPKKRYREEPPIYAQSSRKGGPGNPFLAKNRPPPSRFASVLKQEPTADQGTTIQNRAHVPVKAEVNGHTIATNDIRLPPSQPATQENGPLGPWEPSILNVIPSEEVTRVISDFLFQEVVMRDDVGVAPAGGGKDEGAVLEIEAKIGQLIDKNTNDRIRLPVMSECVVCKDDPGLRIAFKSSMTETQHRKLNNFLNKAIQGSRTPPRIPMNYVHTHEVDTFYDMSQAGALALPQSIRRQMDPRNPRTIPKVRVTTNTRTGEEIAKIIKVRVADIDIYSPRTAFDWRVSVNVEMRINGDLKDLVEPGATGRRGADRNKDRMSYRHLAYQIDLTQVTGTDAANKTDKEHELEIEVASQEVRRQGQLALDRKVSQYEELIRGFADNVRILARHCES